MKVYVITEEQYQSLLKELELIKLKTPDQFAITDEQKAMQLRVVDGIHSKFHYAVCKAIQG